MERLEKHKTNAEQKHPAMKFDTGVGATTSTAALLRSVCCNYFTAAQCMPLPLHNSEWVQGEEDMSYCQQYQKKSSGPRRIQAQQKKNTYPPTRQGNVL